jgi:arylsulfatase
LRTDRAEQHNLADKMPDKAKELAQIWQTQADQFSELAKQTIDGQAPDGTKAKAKAKKAKQP